MQRDDKQGKIPSDQVSSQKATGGVNTASQDNSEVNPDSASRPTGSQARMSHSQAQLHQTCKQYSKLQQSRRREPKNVLTRIESNYMWQLLFRFDVFLITTSIMIHDYVYGGND
ncbi:hypothetical protein LSH36_67g04065 [Paralvinella palmiformis]|uniref:Uncharacterized protein n=1 Tax=Paralvinella palmiformis TaxID=53620 RepID=A0AAD9K508_9ANNE|nr:hypothetical protein LSH36_67g04065 [Paralvinella palmiformis]